MNNISRTTSFILDKIKDTPELARVRYRARWNGYTAAFNCQTIVEVSKWSADTQRCLRNSVHGNKRIPYKEINATLDDLEDKVNDAFAYFEEKDIIPTAEELRNKANELLGRKSTASYIDELESVIDKYLIFGIRERGWADNTVNATKRALKTVQSYNPQFKLDDVNDPDMYKDFVKYLLSTYNNTTANTYAAMFKTFLRWCLKNRYVDNIECIEDTPTIKKSNNLIVFLTKEELEKFRDHEFNTERKNLVRDMYCFSAFTSLRHSDLIALKVGYVSRGVIHMTIKKTGTAIDIELNRHSKALFDKYSKGKTNEDTLFPPVPCPHADKLLCEMFKEMGYDSPINVTDTYNNKKVTKVVPKYQKLTFHTSRKTFICLALGMGIAPVVVMKWTGHSNYDAMKPYIDIATETKKQAMSMFDF